ncbi:MAG: hypothetical protein KJ648_07635 [Candidatus Omnitrophica bacterium]|nr:hypothetical protein [Candidatus Omnitrophota bacterium]
MSFVERALGDANWPLLGRWIRKGIKCNSCPVTWLQDFPDQPMEASGFYRLRTNIPGDEMHACTKECTKHVELIIGLYGDWPQDKDNIRFPIFRWTKMTKDLDLGGGI